MDSIIVLRKRLKQALSAEKRPAERTVPRGRGRRQRPSSGAFHNDLVLWCSFLECRRSLDRAVVNSTYAESTYAKVYDKVPSFILSFLPLAV